ncbi:BTB/POZ domain-containing protein KCTD16-like protein [Willisornis vidua]|uniref:BTB/POZ domain-containing protein KCTD16-like protein n=1 Tax=Willisornis vidua TaxID=1566151 RepID=A0ABQ9DKP2_9PASS|nr:BTB/POZ domain-containing protein KCTD16-like protein [Willisornis vidua]
MAETLPGTDPRAEQKNGSPTNSLPWPEAPKECPARPNTLDLCRSLKRLQEVRQTGQRQGSERAPGQDSGEGAPAAVPALSEERRALQSELGKCIEDFRKIKIPVAFPNKKRQWQSELLRKYQL